MTSNKPLDLDALVQDAGTVMLKGRAVRVRQLTGQDFAALREVRSNPGTALEVMYEIAKRVLPDVPVSDVLGLTHGQVETIVQLAANPASSQKPAKKSKEKK